MYEKTVCFSGHRPEKLPNGGDENSIAISQLKSLLYKEIYDSITGYGDNWRGYDKWALSHIIEKADEVVTICPEFEKSCMKQRNEYMVDHSSKLIAVVSNYRSGTGQTIRYAQKKGINVMTIEV